MTENNTNMSIENLNTNISPEPRRILIKKSETTETPPEISEASIEINPEVQKMIDEFLFLTEIEGSTAQRRMDPIYKNTKAIQALKFASEIITHDLYNNTLNLLGNRLHNSEMQTNDSDINSAKELIQTEIFKKRQDKFIGNA